MAPLRCVVWSCLATAIPVLSDEPSAAVLAAEYAQALEHDDVCLPGGSSCSLVLSQLRATAHSHESLSLEKPVSSHLLEKVDGDLALLAGGVPAANMAVSMALGSLDSAIPGKNVAPAVLHSDLPWATAAAHEAEQKATETEAPAPQNPDPKAVAQIQPQDETPLDQAQPLLQAQLQSQSQAQAPMQPQPELQASSAGVQRAQQQPAAEVAQVEPSAVSPQAMRPPGPAPPQEIPSRIPVAGAPADGLQADIGEDDSGDARGQRRHFLGSDSHINPPPHDKTLDKRGRRTAKTELAHVHNSKAGNPTARSSRKTPQPRDEAHKTEGNEDKYAHTDSPLQKGMPKSPERSYTKTTGGYRDVVLARHASSKHRLHADASASESDADGVHRQQVSLSSAKRHKHHMTTEGTRTLAKVENAIEEYLKDHGSDADTRDNSEVHVKVHNEVHNEVHKKVHNEVHNKVHGEVHSELDSDVDSEGGFVDRLQPFVGHPRWMENCTQIFLDIGSGAGSNIRAMYEPEEVSGSMKFLLTLQQVFKLPKDRRQPAAKSGLCTLGLEPDPSHHRQLHELQKDLQSRGWHVHFYPFAAWSSSAGLLSMEGASVVGETAGGPSSKPATQVMSVGLADFVHSLPASVGVSLLTMDVEGAEDELLSNLLAGSVLCQSIVRSALITGIPTDIAKLEAAQGCSGKVTPIVEFSSYLG